MNLTREDIAIHEASHTTVGLWLGRIIESVSCIPNANTAGRTRWFEPEDRPTAIAVRAMTAFAVEHLSWLTTSDADELDVLSRSFGADYVASFRDPAIRLAARPEVEAGIRRVAAALVARGELTDGMEIYDIASGYA